MSLCPQCKRREAEPRDIAGGFAEHLARALYAFNAAHPAETATLAPPLCGPCLEFQRTVITESIRRDLEHDSALWARFRAGTLDERELMSAARDKGSFAKLLRERSVKTKSPKGRAI